MDEIPDSLVDKVGPWSEVKLDIIRKYAQAYSNILSAKPYFKHVYIDAFAGLGFHKSKASEEYVKGSPRLAVETEPPFKEYHFIDIDKTKVASLETLKPLTKGVVHVYEGNCNPILVNDILPTIKNEDYKRALCLLDPYGLHLDWEVMELAGKMGTVEIFVNFPVMDMNMNILRHNPDNIDLKQADRMTAFWGDDSWRDTFYSNENFLFEMEEKSATNEQVVAEFCNRLKKVAGFDYVAEPLPMRNKSNAVLYYLLFASPNKTGGKIVKDIFDKYR